MEQKEFRFDEGTPFQDFLDQHRDKFVGHTLKACYLSSHMFVKATSDRPVFLVMDDICIGVKYLIPGYITILIADETDFEMIGINENYPEYREIEFHSRNSHWKDQSLNWNTEQPGMNQAITDITIGRFSHRYEDGIDSERPDGGDYFSWIKLTLENGTEFYIEAQPAEQDGYVDLWMRNLSGYSIIKKELDRNPKELGLRLRNEFKDFVQACNATPDELADLAMYYMKKCDHEIEKYREKHNGEYHGAYTLYTDHLHGVIRAFVDRDMNRNYRDASGKALRDLAMEIGDEAGDEVLSLLYMDLPQIQSLDWVERNLYFVQTLIQTRKDDLAETYRNLPKEVKETRFGQRLKELHHDGLWKMGRQIDEMLSNLRIIH